MNLEPGWKEQLSTEFEQPYMKDLRSFLDSEYRGGKTIYPKGEEYFASLNETPFSNVKVVIVGQDPYHGPGQAHGLCFSVKPGVAVPPSLVNIYKELKTDVGIDPPGHGYLIDWARQGVLLLNSVLTVEAGKAGSHQGKGWERFTDSIIESLNRREDPMVFILWGSYAQKKGQSIDGGKHFVVKGPHPSPLSAHRGFFGGRYFSQANKFLIEQKMNPINWKLQPDLDARPGASAST